MPEKIAIPVKQNSGIGTGTILLMSAFAIAVIAAVGFFLVKNMGTGIMPGSSNAEISSTDDSASQSNAGSATSNVTQQQKAEQMSVNSGKSSQMGTNSGKKTEQMGTNSGKRSEQMSVNSGKSSQMGDTGIDYIENHFRNSKWGVLEGNIVLHGETI